MIRLFYILFILFLFVSCSDTVVKSDERLIDQIVVMEEKIQRINIIQLDRGNSFFSDIKEEIVSTPRMEEMKAKKSRLEYIYNKMQEIDDETSAIISFIDECKMELLKNAGEDVKTVDKNNPSTIVWRAYDAKLTPTDPARLNLWAVKDKSNAKVSSSLFVSSDGLNPSVKGDELWRKINDYRLNLVESVGSYTWGKDTFRISMNNINSFSDNKSLHSNVSKMVDMSRANLKEDRQVLIDLYMSLSKHEWYNIDGEKTHWVSATFNNTPLVSAIASLTSLQHEILSARALAMANYKSKVSSDEYVFNKIMPLASGPSLAFEGEEVKIEVIMAAFDSYNQPRVTVDNSTAQITYDGEGKGIVSIVPKKGVNTIKGTVSIKNKSGVEKTENWEWKVNVVSK